MEFKFETKHVMSKTFREFITNAEIGKKNQIVMFQRPITKSYGEIEEECGTQVADMILDLVNIPGVRLIFVEPYSIDVHMDEAFEWNTLIDYYVREACRAAWREEKSPVTNTVISKVYPNKQVRAFGTSFEVSQTSFENFWRPLRETSDAPLKRVGFKGAKLVRRLLNIPGITEVSIRPYEVSITIGIAFEWNKVEISVKQAFEQTFGPFRFEHK